MLLLAIDFITLLYSKGEHPMNNVELVTEGYKHFAEGNVEAVLALFHPELEWDECQGFPYISGDGIFIGGNAVVQGVFAKIPENMDGFHIDILSEDPVNIIFIEGFLIQGFDRGCPVDKGIRRQQSLAYSPQCGTGSSGNKMVRPFPDIFIP